MESSGAHDSVRLLGCKLKSKRMLLARLAWD